MRIFLWGVVFGLAIWLLQDWIAAAPFSPHVLLAGGGLLLLLLADRAGRYYAGRRRAWWSRWQKRMR